MGTLKLPSEGVSCSVMSNSLQPHGLYSPWNSPGQNTGGASLSILMHWNILHLGKLQLSKGFPGGSAGKESACNAGDLGSIPGLGRFPGEGNSYPLQYSGLENSMNCIVRGGLKELDMTWRLSEHAHRHTHTHTHT